MWNLGILTQWAFTSEIPLLAKAGASAYVTGGKLTRVGCPVDMHFLAGGIKGARLCLT